MQNQKTLKVLDISAAKFITHHVVEQIVSNCGKLQEINLTGTKIARETIAFICKNVTKDLRKIGLSYLKVTDENIEDLVQVTFLELE